MTYPALQKVYKNAYPFRIGTTSFIYPDSYIPNVRMLGPYLDEIELLLFESTPIDGLPSGEIIGELQALAEEFELHYNIHLPTDISLGDPDPLQRDDAVEKIDRIIHLTSPLSPTTHTLHLPFEETSGRKQNRDQWIERVYHSVRRLVSSGIDGPSISVETLTYPLEWVEGLIQDFHLSVCVDVGHLFLYGYDCKSVFDKYSDQVSVIHLHGIKEDQDHGSLHLLSEKKTDDVMTILKNFTGTVSLEVFSYEDLVSSLCFLEDCWEQYGPN